MRINSTDAIHLGVYSYENAVTKTLLNQSPEFLKSVVDEHGMFVREIDPLRCVSLPLMDLLAAIDVAHEDLAASIEGTVVPHEWVALEMHDDEGISQFRLGARVEYLADCHQVYLRSDVAYKRKKQLQKRLVRRLKGQRRKFGFYALGAAHLHQWTMRDKSPMLFDIEPEFTTISPRQFCFDL